MDKNEVIETLKLHSKIKTLYKSLLNENNIYAPIQNISDMPKPQNLFSSVTENKALNGNRELNELWKEIMRVNIWLDYLQEEERFVIEQVYFEGRYINHIINKWCNMGKEYHAQSYWKTKHREAIKKITELKPISIPN